MKLRIALAQIDPVLGDMRRNILRHAAAAEEAARAGAKLVVFPELSLSGYSVRDLHWELAVNLQGDLSPFKDLIALSRTITIIAGGVEESRSFGIYNSAFYFEDGNVRTVHRKIYPPTYGMFEEMRYFSRGSSVRAFDTKHGRLGVLICEDLWHLSLPYLIAQDGASAVIALAASPTRLGPEEEKFQGAAVNGEHHRTYARLLSVYLAFCNRVGFEDGVNFWGGSEVINPDGSAAATAKLFEEDLVIAEIDEDEIRRARRFSRHFLDEDTGSVMRNLRRILKERNDS